MRRVWSIYLLAVLSGFAAATESHSAQALGTPSPAERELATADYDYRVEPGASGVWSAVNGAQGLRCRVSREGIEVFPRVERSGGAAWRLALSTASFGRYDDEPRELCAATIATRANRVELDHGALTEWFVNDERGIEHGWTIAKRPSGAGSLWIGLEIGGDLLLRIDGSERAGVFTDARGETCLHYRGLLAFDAAGRELGARLASRPDGVGIEVDDHGATYPVTVDPVLSGPAWTAESNQAFASMGASVASAGDVNGDGYSDVIVGAPLYANGQSQEGRAYAYLGSSSGLSASAAWTAESNQVSALFGASVACAGDVDGDGFSDVIVGAYQYDNGSSDEGRAFVFRGSASGLAIVAAWTAESDQLSAQFGRSVACAGDVNGDGYSDVIVGAPDYDNGQTDEGRAYVYLGSATGLASTPAWTAESNQIAAQFGMSVACAGDVNGDGYDDVIVGAAEFDNGQADEGRAFVYLGSAGGLATSPAWTAEGDQAGAGFGTSVATAGDFNGDGYCDVVIGAPGYDIGLTDQGRSYLYLGSASGLATIAARTDYVLEASAQHGQSVAGVGDVNADGYDDYIVGTPRQDLDPGSDVGSAFVTFGTPDGVGYINDSGYRADQTGCYFGGSVAGAGDVNGDGHADILVGALFYSNGSTSEGRAYAYHGGGAALSTVESWSAASNQASAQHGVSAASAGDVNGDGFGDVIVGAFLFDNGESAEGRAAVYLGSPSGLAATASWAAEGNQASALFGSSVAGAGDVNGDGYGDVIVGAYLFDNGQTNEGRAFVYLGSASGLSTTPAWTAESNQVDAWFGFSVASAGDVNGDGFGDVIVGAYQYDNGQSDEGRAYVYLGSPSGLATSPAWTAESDQAGANFGRRVATAGDVNGDGFSDVIVGAPNFDNGQSNEGRVFVYRGRESGLATSAMWTAESDQASAQFGLSVATAGDVNGDGFSDVIVGAPTMDGFPVVNGGLAFVYTGSATGPGAAVVTLSPLALASFGLQDGEFGASVATAGDIDGDGYSDVIVGAYRSDSESLRYVDQGHAEVYRGSASGVSTTPVWRHTQGPQTGAEFGISVSSAGDVNGDGFADVLVGARKFDDGELDEGAAFVYLGNARSRGVLAAPRQRQTDDSRAISLLGNSKSKTHFRIEVDLRRRWTGVEWATGVAPKARLQWAVAPLRTSLASRRVQDGPLESITSVPFEWSEMVSFQPPATAGGPMPPIPYGQFVWRARLRTNNPRFPVTRWVTMPGSNVTEAKLRVTGPD